MTPQDFSTLQRRVRLLERSLVAVVGGCCGLILLFFTLGTTAETKSDVLRVRGLVILDSDGRERILLGAPIPKVAGRKRPDTPVGMIVLGENGADRLAIGYPPDPQTMGSVVKRISPQAGITLNDKDGNERGGYGVFEDGSINLGLDYATREAVTLFAGADGYSGVMLGGDNEGGHERAGLVINNRTGRVLLKLADTKSEERLMIDVAGDSAAKFILRDPKKNTMVDLIDKLKQ